MTKTRYVVSACLAGVHARYDARATPDPLVIQLIREGRALALCPEQLGGLPTPRPSCEIKGEKIMSQTGTDVSRNFHNGAQEALYLATLFGATKAILKSHSPSCGYKKVYDGTFSRTITTGHGIFTALLIKNGFEIFTEKKLPPV